MRSVTVTERHAWIAVAIFAAAVVAYFWYKNQVAAAFGQGSAAQFELDTATNP